MPVDAHLLLALWSDNWNGSASVSLSLSFSLSSSAGGGGHGHHHHHHHWHHDFYYAADDDWWDERRKMLERYHYKPEPPRREAETTQREPAPVEQTQRYNQILQKLEFSRVVPDLDALRRMQEELQQLALQIEQYELDCDDEEAIMLLCA